MVALMGLSGSGKTTMLNCLTRQIMAQVGEVRVGTDLMGTPATVGYMPDHGNFLEKATVSAHSRVGHATEPRATSHSQLCTDFPCLALRLSPRKNKVHSYYCLSSKSKR